ncbi:DUF4129 domain-containing protein [Haloglomus litoreum]|uniref:DUF4129 domain-containing protein n=1 Tax=Haloglomus litoreum TaxID=3034026 RepID=UPI0023E8FA52|nr:DUF4129 domain-containing protein [Haloglomus sp. DT116]
MRRRVVLVLAVCLVVAGLVTPISAAGASTVDHAGGDEAVLGSTVGTLQAENNTTAVRHRDPDATDEAGNLAAIRGQLAGRMGEITVDCSEGIRIGNYDACDEMNGSYSDALSKYVDVTGRDAGGTEDGTQSAEDYRELQRETRELANETQQFQQTYREYREARRNGNTTRVRRLARELLELREGIQRTGTNVSRSANDVGNRTGISLAAVEQNTQAVTANVTNTTETVVVDVFVPTAMTVSRVGQGNVSARDPLVVTGRVQTANGTAVPNGTVVLATGPGRGARLIDRTRVAVNESGAYRLTYRPTTIPPGERTLSLRYQPPLASVYLPANGTVDTTIEQIRAQLAVGETPETLRYRDEIRAVARVTGGEGESIALQRVPLALRVDGQTLAGAETNGTGDAVLRSRLPAGITPGNRTLTVAGATRGRAVIVGSISRDVRVAPTEAALDARAVQTSAGARTIRVVGRLRADGQGVPAQDLGVRVDGRLVTTLETNATGHYRKTVTVPNASFPATGTGDVGVVVTFDGAGTNLESTRVRQQLTLQRGATASSGGVFDQVVGFVEANPAVVAGGVVLGLLFVAGAFLFLRRRGDEASESVVAAESSAGGADDGGTEGDVERGPGVEAVQEALGDGAYARAVLSGYAAVRRGLPVPEQSSVTHWEFYRRASEAGLSERQLEALRDVTEAFERVSFAGQTPDEDEAASIVETVRNALGDGSDTSVDAARADD